jgi:mediator of RNA polymerase II transcription subunit 12, fungi type
MLRISEILKDGRPLHNISDLQNNTAKAGKVLRLLSNLMETMRSSSSPSPMPQLDPAIRESLISTVYSLLRGIGEHLSSGQVTYSLEDLKTWTSATIFLARVLQFDLGFPGVWTQWLKDRCEEVSQMLSNLILVSKHLVVRLNLD